MRRQGPVIILVAVAPFGFTVASPEAATLAGPSVKLGVLIKPPDPSAIRMYDVVHTFKRAVEESGVTNTPADLEKDRDRIRQWLSTMKDFSALGGTGFFNPDGDVVQDAATVRVEGSRFLEVR